MSAASFRFVVCFSFCFVAGCEGVVVDGEGEGEGEEGEGEGDINDDPPGDEAVLVGAFALKLDDPPSLLGKVFDGPTPAGVVFDVERVVGDCALSIPRVPFCNTPCGAALCVDDDVCQEFPSSQPVGTVTVTGLTDDAFAMEPIGNSYQPGFDVFVEVPAPGLVFSIAAQGSSFSRPFVLDGHGIAPVVLVDDEDLGLVRGADFVVGFVAADPALARMHVKLDISHHGGTRGVVECDADDDGSIVVDADLVDALLDLGVAGFPSVVVSRVSMSHDVIGAGRVDLNVVSSVERAVEVAGLLSCLGDEDCDAPLTCQSDLVCR